MSTESEIRLRPELLIGPNPFIEAADPFVPFAKLPEKLMRYPLKGHDWTLLTADMREPLLAFAELHFAPTQMVLEPASGLQMLFRRSLVLRNPLDPDERIRTNRIALAQSFREVVALARLDGAGLLMPSITGMGKTTITKRTLEVICPDPVIVHGASKACGWLKLTQCLYVWVNFPSNGTKGGLLASFLVEIDSKLGTDYSKQYARTRNNDHLMAVVCKLLTVHRVALVVIDEAQVKNFGQSPWLMEFAIFYLILMNLGVSVVLLGNLVAFEYFKLFAQLMRRFSVGGVYELHPAKSSSEGWWKDDYIPRMRKFSVVESCNIDSAKRSQIEFDFSAGIPGLQQALHIESQRAALRRGGPIAILEDQDYETAKASPRYKEDLLIAQSLRDKSEIFADVSTGDLGTTCTSKESADAGTKATVDAAKALISRFKSETTRQANNIKRKLETLLGVSEEDLRMLGLTEELKAQVEARAHTRPAPAKG